MVIHHVMLQNTDSGGYIVILTQSSNIDILLYLKKNSHSKSTQQVSPFRRNGKMTQILFD